MINWQWWVAIFHARNSSMATWRRTTAAGNGAPATSAPTSCALFPHFQSRDAGGEIRCEGRFCPALDS